ncbi:hypothetical protein ACIBXA_25810 [Micromonospora echinaurantiaca]|uniref:hypothetical protein n=1 Tax=Micromonospora echinaurantiaca TaxID=47857 RepID=UPI0037AE7EE0
MPTRPDQTSRARRLDTPIFLGSLAAVALGAVGAFLGFGVLGSIGPVPTLLLLIVVVFAVGATVTVRRIFALRTTDDASDRRHGRG